MKKMFLMPAFCCTAVLQAQDYYVVTGDNVNVRSQPVTGKVVGKVSSVNSFTGWVAGNGWVNFRIPSVSGAISDKFVRKVALRDFSRSMLGEYMGKASLPVSYSMGTLSEREGYVVLQVTDYTEPDGESGLRGHTSHVYAGIPNKDGISFTHYLYPYSEDKPLVQQMADAGPLEQPYEFVVTEEGELRAYDRGLEMQKSAGSQGAKMTELYAERECQAGEADSCLPREYDEVAARRGGWQPPALQFLQHHALFARREDNLLRGAEIYCGKIGTGGFIHLYL